MNVSLFIFSICGSPLGGKSYSQCDQNKFDYTQQSVLSRSCHVIVLCEWCDLNHSKNCCSDSCSINSWISVIAYIPWNAKNKKKKDEWTTRINTSQSISQCWRIGEVNSIISRVNVYNTETGVQFSAIVAISQMLSLSIHCQLDPHEHANWFDRLHILTYHCANAMQIKPDLNTVCRLGPLATIMPTFLILSKKTFCFVLCISLIE